MGTGLIGFILLRDFGSIHHVDMRTYIYGYICCYMLLDVCHSHVRACANVTGRTRVARTVHTCERVLVAHSLWGPTFFFFWSVFLSLNTPPLILSVRISRRRAIARPLATLAWLQATAAPALVPGASCICEIGCRVQVGWFGGGNFQFGQCIHTVRSLTRCVGLRFVCVCAGFL